MFGAFWMEGRVMMPFWHPKTWTNSSRVPWKSFHVVGSDRILTRESTVQFSCVSKTGWWFGTFFIFPYIGNNHPNWLSYFSEGFKPPTRKCHQRNPNFHQSNSHISILGQIPNVHRWKYERTVQHHVPKLPVWKEAIVGRPNVHHLFITSKSKSSCHHFIQISHLQEPDSPKLGQLPGISNVLFTFLQDFSQFLQVRPRSWSGRNRRIPGGGSGGPGGPQGAPLGFDADFPMGFPWENHGPENDGELLQQTLCLLWSTSLL